MSEDVVEKIRCVIAENFGDTGAVESGDIHELMDELEKCRAENKELNAVFDLERTRTQKAQHLWREATGNHNTIPDLGVLLEWLMDEIKRLAKRNDNYQTLSGIAIRHGIGCQLDAEKQRRHRKWILKKARNNLEGILGMQGII